jgi:anti-sigma B factor antagonist
MVVDGVHHYQPASRAGLVLSHLARLPHTSGGRVQVGHWIFEVRRVTDRRITEVRISPGTNRKFPLDNLVPILYFSEPRTTPMNQVPFSVESRKVDTGETQIIVTGEIDLATAPQLEQQLARSRGRIVVDLRTVDFMDTTGIRVLLSQKARLEARRGHLRLLIGTDLIRRLLELSGVIDMFEIDESLHPSAQSEHQLHSGLKAV